MQENLVIVESPAKAKTIEKFLGKDFLVKSSFGHIRDLSKKNLGIDIEHNFKPEYVISDDKKKVVAELKKLVKKAKLVWLASDEDREGEAIAWHLTAVLQLNDAQTRRIVFNEITKDAILNAIKNPRNIDLNLVNAQQARRILDRLVGFELSPILWKKIKPALSAGRVQSVAVRLLVEREREINAFQSVSYFKVTALFEVKDPKGSLETFPAELSVKFQSDEETRKFLEKCKNATFRITEVTTKPSRKSAPPPFTTSTLQQEASKKLGFSVSQTMTLAQKLYEAGKITYMRTDSVNLSDLALNVSKKVIASEFGAEYSQPRQYKTKTKGAQEAHEAIRPTYIEKETITGSATEKKLYDLIRKRTLASQMSDALIEKTTAVIEAPGINEHFIATGEVIKFDGFLKLYRESEDEEQEEKKGNFLPPLRQNQDTLLQSVNAVQKFTYHPPRYTEASLVKKLEELGIGRPSTYAPTISTIQQRGYVVKEDRPGKPRDYMVISLLKNKITEQIKTEITGAEKAKLFPTDIGMIVNDFLVQNFEDILDYNFTATVEKEFDLIAEGQLEWTKMIHKFYDSFHRKVEETLTSKEKSKGERLLGTDPETGKPVFVKIGRFGPMVQIGDANDGKPRFASLLKGQSMDSVTLEDALAMFQFPRKLGIYMKSEVTLGIGRFGPYILHDKKFYSLNRNTDNPLKVTLERAIEIIEEKKQKDQNKLIKEFPEKPGLRILNGRYGPYIAFNNENYRIPKTKNPAELTLDECMAIIENKEKTPRKTVRRKKS